MTPTLPAQTRVMNALLDIISERGLDHVTIREVASTAGVSIGTVQYYCRSKDEMLALAFDHVTQNALERVDAIPRAGDVGAVLRVALQEFMPLDERRSRETRIYLAFATRAIVSTNLSATQHAIMAKLRELCADAFRLAEERGQTRAGTDAEQFAATTLALLDGLSLQLLADPAGLEPGSAIAIANLHLARHFRMDPSQ